MSELITAANVAELLGVEPNTVHRLNKLRASAVPGSVTERLTLLPEPAQAQPYQLWERREIIRCRAYREGGDMAARAERVYLLLSGVGADFSDAALILDYPTDAEFAEWLNEQRVSELREVLS